MLLLSLLDDYRGSGFSPLNTGRHRTRASWFHAIVVATIAACASHAQMTSGSLTGSVMDSSGAAIPSATVEAVNSATGIKATGATNAAGEYRFANLAVGSYNLRAAAAGFTTSELTGVAVDLNKEATANVVLQVGSTSSTVEVVAAASTIDTSTAQITTDFGQRLASDLPSSSVGSGVLNLSLLAAGVSTSGGLGAGMGPSVGGQRPRNNNFTVEGIDENNKTVTGALMTIPNDDVGQFTLIQNQYTAEYGHSSGGQFNTNIKSGTNDFHGTLYDYLQNRNLNAVNNVAHNNGISDNPRFDSNRLGANLGGPIIRNKWFFFGAAEYNPIGQDLSLAGIETPTAAGYATLANLASSGAISNTNYSVLKQYAPVALSQAGSDSVSVLGQNIPIGYPTLVAPTFSNQYVAIASSDYNFSDKDQLRGRYIFNNFEGQDTSAQFATFFTPLPVKNYLVTVTEYHTFTPSLLNELRLGYNRLNQNFTVGGLKFPGLDVFPNLEVDDLALNLGPDTSAPQFTIQNTYQITDNISWTYGNHAFKFGFDGRKYISPQGFTQRSRGEYEYSTLENYLRDLQPDEFAARGVGNYTYYGDQIALYGYAQDTWKATPNLSVNLGVRYEFTSVPYSERLQSLNSIASVPGLIDFHAPTPQYLNFAPRIGLAYSPGHSGTTSIRAGFGINYDVLYDNIGILETPPEVGTQYCDVLDGCAVPANPSAFLATGAIPGTVAVSGTSLTAAEARANTTNLIADQKLPYSIQWNLGIQHVFFNDYVFQVRYVGTRGVHLDVQDRLNNVSPVTPTSYLPTYLTQPSQATLDSLPLTLADLQAKPTTLPAFDAAGFPGSITTYLPVGSSTYHSLQVQLEKRLSKGLSFTSAYTWSHNIDNSTADFFSTYLTPRRPQDFNNLTAEKGTSALDRRQRFTIALIYDAPWFASRSNYFLKNVVGNWEIAPIYTYESPEYYTVQSGLDSNLNTDSAPDRTIINPSGAANTGSGVTALTNSAGDVVGYLANDPSARYIVAGKGALSNGGRNTLAGNPINNWDLTALKRFSVTERFKIEFQVQALNVFNHSQFIPGSIDDVASIGQAGSAIRSFLTPGSALFNRPDQVFSSQPRTVQLTAKVTF